MEAEQQRRIVWLTPDAAMLFGSQMPAPTARDAFVGPARHMHGAEHARQHDVRRFVRQHGVQRRIDVEPQVHPPRDDAPGWIRFDARMARRIARHARHFRVSGGVGMENELAARRTRLVDRLPFDAIGAEPFAIHIRPCRFGDLGDAFGERLVLPMEDAEVRRFGHLPAFLVGTQVLEARDARVSSGRPAPCSFVRLSSCSSSVWPTAIILVGAMRMAPSTCCLSSGNFPGSTPGWSIDFETHAMMQYAHCSRHPSMQV